MSDDLTDEAVDLRDVIDGALNGHGFDYETYGSGQYRAINLPDLATFKVTYHDQELIVQILKGDP